MKNKRIIIPITIVIIIVIISIIYNTFPRLQLNGKNYITISYRDKYQEPGVIVKNANNNYLSKVKIESNIDNEKIGNYYVDYSLKLGARQLHIRRNVNIIDDIAPVIKLKGNQIIELSINQEYQEPGYIAIDEYDGNITEKVQIIGQVDIENYGEYIIKYKVKDNSNNTVEVNRIVKVIDETVPNFECKTEYSAFEISSENIVGCKAIDNFDGDITHKVKVNGEYDINKKGLYNIEYTVEDDAGNESKINHTIIMYEPIKDKEVYIITNDNKEIQELLKENKIKATIFKPSNNNEDYINSLKEKEYEIGLKIGDKTYTSIDKLKEYCMENEIRYFDIKNNMPKEKIAEIIRKINYKKIVIINDSDKVKELEIFIQLLKEMNYSFETISNLK